MKNAALYLNMISRYNAIAFTHSYIFGFHYAGNIYMAYADAEMLPSILKLDNAGRNQGHSIRFCPNKGIKLALMPTATLLCSTKYFDAMVSNSKYNKGEIFEKLVTEHFGQQWHKDNVPFTEDGDITVANIAYQVKFERATFTTEKTLMKLERA